jgi:hypothetical protein
MTGRGGSDEETHGRAREPALLKIAVEFLNQLDLGDGGAHCDLEFATDASHAYRIEDGIDEALEKKVVGCSRGSGGVAHAVEEGQTSREEES